MIADSDRQILCRTYLLGALPSTTLNALLDCAAVQWFDKDAVVFRQHDRAEHFYAVLDGWVKISRSSTSGDEAVLGLFGPGETFAEAAMFLGGRYPATATAVQSTRVCRFSRAAFTAAALQSPEVCFSMLGSVSMHLHGMITQVEQLKTRNGEQRLAKFLANLCGGADGPCTIALPYDKSLIAARLGMRPESLSRHLTKLAEFGVRNNGDSVSIEDVARLREVGELTPLRKER